MSEYDCIGNVDAYKKNWSLQYLMDLRIISPVRD